MNGRDLMAAGVPAGPGIRKVLEALLDGVIREEYPNERQAPAGRSAAACCVLTSFFSELLLYYCFSVLNAPKENL